MSTAIENLQAAQKRGLSGRPKVGGFTYSAEMLRLVGPPLIGNVFPSERLPGAKPA